MTYIEFINDKIFKLLREFLNLQNNNISFKITNESITAFIKLSTAVFNSALLITLFLVIFNVLINIFFKNNAYVEKIVRHFNIFLISVNLGLLIIKFYIALKLESVFTFHMADMRWEFFSFNNNLSYLEHFVIFSSSFSDGILILCYITGIICLELLGFKNLFKNFNNISIFFFFIFFVTIMVSTNNLLVMFICFEFIFLPTIYFAYKLGYSKKIDKSTEILFYWTLFGSFMILCNLAYIYYTYNTLNYIFLTRQYYTEKEMRLLFMGFLIGFGIKIPLAPLHFWLLKVHVESPTAFSIFLSGFLVKSALYCLFMLIGIFRSKNHHTILLLWSLYSLLVGTIGLGRQIDIKKLIAWATIQEMSFMMVFLIFKQIFLTHTFVLFVVLHGIMSSYMFFVIDIMQRRYKTREFQKIRGLHIILPKLTKHIWFLILLFSGFPLTAKFIIEWFLISLMIETSRILLILTIFFVNFIGIILFSKIFFTMIYGVPENIEDDEFYETQKKEYVLLNFLTLIIIILIFLIYFF